MQKRPLCGMAAGFVLGILAAAAGNPVFLTAAVLTGTLSAVFFGNRRFRRNALCMVLFLAFFLLGGARSQTEIQKREAFRALLTDGMSLTVSGELAKKEEKNNQYLYYLKNCHAVFSKGILPCNQIIAYSDADTDAIGKTLIVKGKTENWRTAANEGNFDEQAYYDSRMVAFQLKRTEIIAAYGEADFWKERLSVLRERMRQVYEQCFSEEESGIMAAITLGDTTLLGRETKELYQKTGVSHILAISGLHISVIGMSLFRLLRKIRLSDYQAGVLSGIFMTGYGIFSGFGTSTKRAIIMFLIMLLGQAIGRSYDSLSALSASAILILWENPFLIGYAGFLFSYTAVLGVVVLGKAVSDAGVQKREEDADGKEERKNAQEQRKSEKWMSKWKETFLLSFCIQIVILPLTAWYYFEIPLYAVFLNLLILPFVGVLLFLGICGGITGMFCLPAAKLLFLPCRLILSFFAWVLKWGGSLPYASIVTGKPGLFRLILIYLLLFLLTLWVFLKKRRKGIVPAGLLILSLLLLPPVSGFELDVLDVGQGDGCYLQTENGIRFFIDGGSSDIKGVGTYRILPFLKAKGVRKIDYWIISHTDSDHISGLLELLKAEFPIGALVFSAHMEKDEKYEELAELARGLQTELIFLNQGDCLRLNRGALICLSPEPGDSGADKNARSLVVAYKERGFTGIFTGDIGLAEEKRLAESDFCTETDFIKASHHGSNGSNSSELLFKVRPRIIAVSCAAENAYGHPGAEAVKRMEESGGSIYYTMKYGQIKIRKGKGEDLIVTQIGKQQNY